ncbi:MAG: haloalkane dehalogenase [Caulobacterales bacterium]|nr:haloalkane dehalogenase [Caulobacterales bacterium]
MTDVLRTPDDRFADLPDWPYAPRYVDDLPGYGRMRLHYVDEGPADAGVTFLCLHGEPTWSFLYRRMIPVFTAAGHRVVAPDWFGFGRSDKPAEDAVYTWSFHRGTLTAFFERMDLRNVCLVVQDWGGLLGLTLPKDYRDRITRMIVMNTGLGIGRSPGEGWEAWRAYAQSQPDMAVGRLIARGTPHLTPAEIAAYDAPFPDIRHKAGVRAFPEIVPRRPEMDGVADSKAALAFFKDAWAGETFMAMGMQDPVLGAENMRALASAIRGCPEPMEVADGGHFVQEWGAPVAEAALAHFGLA